MIRHAKRFVALLILAAVTAIPAAAQRGGRGRGGTATDGGANGLGALHFRFLGPEGNRVGSITGVPAILGQLRSRRP
jgi:hypothetical protein